MNKILSATLGAWLALICGAMAQSPGTPMLPTTPAFTGFSLLAKSGAASAHTGDTNEALLATIPIPANTIGANGQIRLITYWTCTNSANTKTIRVRLGTTGLSSAVISNFPNPMTTVGAVWVSMLIQNTNATNAQNNFTEAARGGDGIVFTLNTTSSADMTVAENFYISGQLALGSETITLIGYSFEAAF